MMNIMDHEGEAWRLWYKHVCECAQELGITFDSTEAAMMHDSFTDTVQLKILHETGEVKVKWENSCWWADCPNVIFHGQYYCVLSKGPFYHPGKGEEE